LQFTLPNNIRIIQPSKLSALQIVFTKIMLDNAAGSINTQAFELQNRVLTPAIICFDLSGIIVLINITH
jgi:hypothetical protein